MKLRVVVECGNEKDVVRLLLHDDASLPDLMQSFANETRFKDTRRHRFLVATRSGKQDPLVLVAGLPLQELGVKDGDTVLFRPMDRHASWQTAKVVESVVSLFLYSLLFGQPSFVYGENLTSKRERHLVQILALYAWTIHFGLRVFEAVVVYTSSDLTMPWKNVLKNGSFYAGGAVMIGYFVNHPLYTPPSASILIYGGFSAFVLGEVFSLLCHVSLARVPPSTIPRGFLFNYITCPYYTSDTVAWIGFHLATCTAGGWIFMLVHTIQMIKWARARHTAYLKQFDGREGRAQYPRHRHCMF